LADVAQHHQELEGDEMSNRTRLTLAEAQELDAAISGLIFDGEATGHLSKYALSRLERAREISTQLVSDLITVENRSENK
jgi:hypothetical protein